MSQIQSAPSWTGYQKIVSLKVTSPTTIGNCWPIPVPTWTSRLFKIWWAISRNTYQPWSTRPLRYSRRSKVLTRRTSLLDSTFLKKCNIKIGKVSQNKKLLRHYWKAYESIPSIWKYNSNFETLRIKSNSRYTLIFCNIKFLYLIFKR